MIIFFIWKSIAFVVFGLLFSSNVKQQEDHANAPEIVASKYNSIGVGLFENGDSVNVEKGGSLADNLWLPGKELFTSKCIACLVLTAYRKIGTGLKGIT